MRCFIIAIIMLGCTNAPELCGPDNNYGCAVELHVDRGGGVHAVGQGVAIGEHEILTAAHVVAGAVEIVAGDRLGRSATTKSHPTADLAIIHFAAPLDLPVADIASPPPAGAHVVSRAQGDRAGVTIGMSERDVSRTLYRWDAPGMRGGDSGAGIFYRGDLVGIHCGRREIDGETIGFAASSDFF